MTFSIPFSSIVEGSRIRNDKKYGDLSGLKESLQAVGSIHPIVLNKRADGTHELVAGGRRYRAMQQLGTKELYHGSVLDPARLGFLFRDEVPEHVWREAELDENLHRLDMDWIDTTLAIHDLHMLKKATNTKWGVRQTGELMKMGKSQVNLAVNVGQLLRSGDKEIAACTSLMEANSLRLKRAEDAALKELQSRVTPRVSPSVIPGTPSTLSFLDSFSINTTKPVLSVPVIGPQTAPMPQVQEKIQVPLSGLFSLGDSIFSDVPWPIVDHIITDIPYGISMDNLSNVEDLKATHQVSQNVSLFQPFLQKSYAALKPGGFCVFFYDLDHHEKLQNLARSVGFKVQRWPLIACKTSACQNNAAFANLTKNYEVAMFCRKDGALRHDTRFTFNNSSWSSYDFSAECNMYDNLFAKPFSLWKDIYDMVAFTGQSVLDPYAGEGSSCRAAAMCGLVPYGIELDERRYNRLLENMKKVYAVIHNSNCEFV